MLLVSYDSQSITTLIITQKKVIVKWNIKNIFLR